MRRGAVADASIFARSLDTAKLVEVCNDARFEGYDLLRNQEMLRFVTSNSLRGLYNDACNLLTAYAELADRRADTLNRVVSHVQRFAQLNGPPDVWILLAAGSSGVEAAKNIVVKKAWWQMLKQALPRIDDLQMQPAASCGGVP